MSKYARILNSVVEELVTPLEGFTIADSFNPSVAGEWIECDQVEGIDQRWTYDGSNFHPPAPIDFNASEHQGT